MEVIKNCSQETGPRGGENPNCPRLVLINSVACSDNENEEDTKDVDSDVPYTVEMKYQFLYYYMNIAEKYRLSAGHDFSDMIKFCSFKGKDCPPG